MTEEETLARGTAADRICSDPVYQTAWESLLKDLFTEWAASPLDDVAGRERLRLELDVATRFKGKFAKYMNEAEMIRQLAKQQDTAI